VYLVRCGFKNRFGAPFHWDFSVDTDDELVAVSEAVMIFWSGLTFEEREDAAHTLEVMGHRHMLPDAPPPVR
jgi:peptide subunit release factor RF-3